MIVPVTAPTSVVMREPRHARRGLAYVLLAVGTIGVFIAALVAARGLLGSTGVDLNAPTVVHQTLAQARTTLSGSGFTVGPITYRFTDKDNKGQVIDQNPPGGSLLHKGQPIALTVSEGIKLVTMPIGLRGQTIAGAEASLAAAGFSGSPNIVPRNSSAPANQVLASKPAAGASVASDSPVTLYVSNAHVKVPDVTLKDPSTASGILLESGFNPQIKRAAEYVKGEDGLIISQTPTAGTFATSGSVVIIYLDKKPPPPPPPSSPPPSSPPPTVIPTGTITPTP
jgi:serine/threonine-protein kinase